MGSILFTYYGWDIEPAIPVFHGLICRIGAIVDCPSFVSVPYLAFAEDIGKVFASQVHFVQHLLHFRHLPCMLRSMQGECLVNSREWQEYSGLVSIYVEFGVVGQAQVHYCFSIDIRYEI